VDNFTTCIDMSGKFWTTEPNGYLEPRLSDYGTSSLTPKTVIQIFQETVQKHGNEKAMAIKRPVNVFDTTHTFTFPKVSGF
jgi:hypothetical protein